jgi:putative phage-type endonuclease
MNVPTAARRVTPNATLVLPATADRAEWLAARRGGVGSSDIAALMGATTYAGPQHVYYSKVGRLPLESDAGEAALWGTLHEETVAREWARRNRTVVRRVGLIASVGDPWMMCTLDRRCTECPLNGEVRESCAVEIKTRDKMLAGKWRKDIPDDVLAQVLWQIHIAGYDHLHVAVLIGGNDYRQYTIYRRGNEQLISDIVTVASRFWHEHVLARRVPAALGTERPEELIDLYEQLNPGRTGWIDLERHPSAYWDVAEYVKQRRIESDAKKAKDYAKARLVDALGGAVYARFDGDDAYAFEEYSKRHVNVARLAERWPDAYADAVADKPFRKLSIEKRYAQEVRDDVAA